MKKIMTAGIALMTVAMSAMAHDNRFCISKHGKTSPVIVDRQDWKGVIRAANDLGDDVRKVTGVASEVRESTTFGLQPSIVVGTIGKSRIIDQLIKQKKLNVTQVKGKWESFVIDVVDGHLGTAEQVFDRQNNDFGWAHLPKSFMNQNTVFLLITAMAANFYRYIVALPLMAIQLLKIQPLKRASLLA